MESILSRRNAATAIEKPWLAIQSSRSVNYTLLPELWQVLFPVVSGLDVLSDGLVRFHGVLVIDVGMVIQFACVKTDEIPVFRDLQDCHHRIGFNDGYLFLDGFLNQH